MKKMTVAELKRMLEEVPDDAVLVIRNPIAHTVFESASARTIRVIKRTDGRYSVNVPGTKGKTTEVVVFD